MSPTRKKKEKKIVKSNRTTTKLSQKTPLNKTVKNKSPTGVQNHGKIWENEILRKVYEISPSNIPYTSVHDIPKKSNKFTGYNVSIKATGTNKVDFGDAMRIYDTAEKGSPLESIIIKYKQQGDKKKIAQILRLDLTNSKNKLFGTLPNIRERIQTLTTLVKENNPSYKSYAKQLQTDMKKSGSFLTIAPKIGNAEKKRSGRVQISLSNVENYTKKYPESVIEQTHCSIHGCNITSELTSGRRVLNKKSSLHKLAPILESSIQDIKMSQSI